MTTRSRKQLVEHQNWEQKSGSARAATSNSTVYSAILGLKRLIEALLNESVEEESMISLGMQGHVGMQRGHPQLLK